MSRTQRWLEEFNEAENNPRYRELLKRNGISLAKNADAMTALRARQDLQSIHSNEYRGDGDEEIRAALTEARAALERLSGLLWRRLRR